MKNMSTQKREKDTGRPTQFGGRYAEDPKDTDTVGSLTTRPHQHETPIEVDTQLAEIHGRAQKQQFVIERLTNTRNFYQEALDKVANGGWSHYTQADLDTTNAKIAEAEAELQEILDEMVPFDEEFDARGGWTRAFLVANNGGHIHRSMRCTTCFPTTKFEWRPEVSGMDEEEIVKLAGDGACTVCYPSAPVADKKNPRPIQFEPAEKKAARLEREKKKAEREEKARLTGIWNPDGTPLMEAPWRIGGHGYPIKTERAAEMKAVEYLYYKNMYGNDGQKEYDDALITYERIIPALAAKRGVTEAEVIAVVREKANKKRKKDGRAPLTD